MYLPQCVKYWQHARLVFIFILLASEWNNAIFKLKIRLDIFEIKINSYSSMATIVIDLRHRAKNVFHILRFEPVLIGLNRFEV